MTCHRDAFGHALAVNDTVAIPWVDRFMVVGTVTRLLPVKVEVAYVHQGRHSKTLRYPRAVARYT